MTPDNKDEPKGGPQFIKSILREANRPLTTKELQQAVHKRVEFCLFDSVVALNVMRVSGTIKGERSDRGWVWWVEDKGKEV